MNKIITNNKGVAVVLMVVMIVTGMLNIAIVASAIVNNGLVMSRAHINSTKAYYAAESGTERMLWKIRKTGPPAFDPTIDAQWHDVGRCVDMTGFDKANINCDSNNSNMYSSPLANKTKYKIKYEFAGNNATDPAIFTTTGDYDNITKRVVQVKYYFK